MHRVLHIFRMIAATPILFMLIIAAPASTLETTSREPEEISENARGQLPSTASFIDSNKTSGAAPPDDVITAGLTHPGATNVGLIRTVQWVHARKCTEGFNFITAFREVSEALRKPPTQLRTLTPKEVAVEEMRHVAEEVKEHPDALEEDERINKANECPVQEDEGDDDNRGKKRTTFFPRP